MQIIYHLLCLGPTRYLEYSIASIFCLIKNGGVEPSNIYITCDEKYKKECPYLYSLLSAMKINVRDFVDRGHHNKHLEVDRLMKATNTNVIVQIDCDCFYIGQPKNQKLILPLDFYIKPIIKDHTIACFEHGGNALDMYERMKVLGKPYVDDKIIIEGIYGYDFDYAIEILKNQKWIHGGVIIYNCKKLENDEVWKRMICASYLTTCDETVIVQGRICEPDWFQHDMKQLVHNQNPTDLSKLEILSDQPEFIHVSGDWFRLQNIPNKNKINSFINKCIKSI